MITIKKVIPMKKIIVGKSVSGPDLLGTIFFISLLSLLFSWFLALYAGRNWFSILWIGLSVVNLCLWLPVVAASHKYWLVDQDHIGYVQIDRWPDHHSGIEQGCARFSDCHG